MYFFGPALVGVIGQWVLPLGCALGSAVWIKHLAHLIRYRRQVIFLADLPLPIRPPGPSSPLWPGVALIFAARDEAIGVETAVRSMLAEDEADPDLCVVAVDDRSTDGTGAILDRLAQAHPRLAVVHIKELPDGWLGKTNALQVGAAAATAAGRAPRWLLFTDADVVFERGAIRRAIAYAEATGVDQITVAPEVTTRSAGERIFVCLFGLLFSLYGPLGHLSDRRRRTAVGVGAFNLVRGDVFHAVGGFRHLALSVDDDVRFGQTIKYAGYSMRFLFGRGAVSVRWQVGTWGMIRGIEKNFFGGLKYSLARVVIVALGTVAVGIGPFAGIFIGPLWTRFVAGIGLSALTIILVASGRQSRIGWWYGLLFPVAALLVVVALVRSVAITLSQGGVNWRGRLYPLAALKAHIRDRDAWLEEVWRSTR